MAITLKYLNSRFLKKFEENSRLLENAVQNTNSLASKCAQTPYGVSSATSQESRLYISA
jgi:hypothetical protein